MVSPAATKAAKPVSTKTKTSKPANSKATAKSTASHPSWKDMITECITAHRDEARSGVSRATIKKYVSETYKIEIEGVNASQLNRAIAHGVDVGVFALPKGPSGKVKLAPKNKPAPANENAQPVGAKKVPTKAAAAPAKKPAKAAAPAKPAKLAATPAKKARKIATGAVAKKTSSAKAVAKKPTAQAAATKSKAAHKPRTRVKKPAVV